MSTTIVTPSVAVPVRASGFGQWSAISGAVLGGFAATTLLTTLGVALGLSFLSAKLDNASNRLDDTAFALGGAAIAWILLTAVAVGAVGGAILARTARPDRPYRPGTHGLITWAGGILLAALVSIPGATGTLAGLGNAADSMQQAANRPAFGNLQRARDAREPVSNNVPVDAGLARGLNESDSANQARYDAAVASGALSTMAWTVLVAQLLSLGATILVAKRGPAPYLPAIAP
jgi:hypothetical protein